MLSDSRPKVICVSLQNHHPWKPKYTDPKFKNENHDEFVSNEQGHSP